MSLPKEGHGNNHSNHTSTLVLFTAVILLSGQLNCARSAVLEELDNGAVVNMNDGVSADTPSTAQRSVRTGELSSSDRRAQRKDPPAAAKGSILVDLPRATLHRRASNQSDVSVSPAMLGQKQQLPQPRALARTLSTEQLEMRRLTVAVGRSYARTSAVRRASLDRESFTDLFTVMIHRESNFNPAAVSPAGAKGLGQLMPLTARDLGVCDVFSARENLEGAARYLTAMLDRFRSPELALAAYNAGPEAVERYGGIPPYRETQQYVSDIFYGAGRTPNLSHGRGSQKAAPMEELPSKSAGFSIADLFGFTAPAPSSPQPCALEAKADRAAFD